MIRRDPVTAPGPSAATGAAVCTPRWAATARPARGAVSWNITLACNYQCSYCTQRGSRRDRPPLEAACFLSAFARLGGDWEVKLSGGEPFVHPELETLVAGLSDLGHLVSIVTNASAPRDRLLAFVEAARGRIGVFSCSLHPEHQPDADAFFTRAAWLSEVLARRQDPSLPRPRVSVSVVATRTMLPRLESLADLAADHGLVLKVQPEKQGREVIAYSPEEQALILSLGGHNQTGLIAPCFQGRPCWAGARYFILDPQGQAHRCYPSRRWQRARGQDFLSDRFALASGPEPCPFPYCNCTVPMARGMMPIEEYT